MKKREEPIIQSLLEDDVYKATMGQVIFHRHPDVPVDLHFINRTKKVRLAELIDIGQLREELEHCLTLRYAKDDNDFMRDMRRGDQPMFQADYCKSLETFSLPGFTLGRSDGQLDVRFPGSWSRASRWEIPAMKIVNTLYYEALLKEYGYFQSEIDMIEAGGKSRLDSKVKELRKHPNITFSDFGNRRAFSPAWHDYVVGVLAAELPGQFLGASNMFLARKHRVKPVGTNAHELPMVYSGIYWDEDEKDPTYSQRQVLADWEAEYGLDLSLFLPDTWGSDWFFKNVVTPDQLRRWKGSRQDSGSPFEYAEKRIREYQEAGIDPKKKLIVFSDGLDLPTMVEIATRLEGRIQYTFGWGTSLTNDLGFGSLSIIVKPWFATTRFLAKLSDNIAKATGNSEAVARAVRLVQYSNTFRAECRY